MKSKSKSPQPSVASAKTPRGRFGSGLSPIAQRLLVEARSALVGGVIAQAEAKIAALAALAPDHPDVRMTEAQVLGARGRGAESIARLREAVAAHGDHAPLQAALGAALYRANDFIGAIEPLRCACELDGASAVNWYNLGRTLKALACTAESVAPLERAIALDARHLPSHVVLGDTFKSLGDIVRAEALYRRATKLDPRSGIAWFSLANLKTSPLRDEDIADLRRACAAPNVPAEEQAALRFALAKALEDVGRYDEAFAVLADANARKRSLLRWDTKGFSAQIRAMRDAFDGPVGPQAADPALGESVIFVLSLPRSGSTLVEQIIGAHPQVNAASELSDLPDIVSEECARRGSFLPDWAGAATVEDWERLGREYLRRTERWRRDTPRFTDKGLSNWMLVGAIRRMLPAARIVVCRRDPLETCLSCYRQLFPVGHEFCYGLDDIVAFWRDFDRLTRFWIEREPGRLHELVYERLQQSQEDETRRLLEALALPFDPACLHPERLERSVRTASAAQVRQPLQRDTGRARHYAGLLDPLRERLAAARDEPW